MFLIAVLTYFLHHGKPSLIISPFFRSFKLKIYSNGTDHTVNIHPDLNFCGMKNKNQYETNAGE